MAFPPIFIDPIDQYGVIADVKRYWPIATTTGMSLVTGRTGGQGIRFTTTTGILTAPLNGDLATVIGLLSFKTAVTPGAAMGFFEWIDGTTVQCGLGLNTSRQLFFYRNTTATVLGTGASVLATGQWYTLEIKVTISDASGVAKLVIDGASASPELNLTSQDTKQTANAFANVFRIKPSASTPDFTIDDVAVWDTTGSAPWNDMLTNSLNLGMVMDLKLPVDDGDLSELTPDSGTDHFARVNEVYDADTSYLSGTGRELFTVSPYIGSVPAYFLGAAGFIGHRKTETSHRRFRPIVKSAGVVYNATARYSSTDYLWWWDGWAQDPNGPADWTANRIDAAQFGAESEL